MEEARELCEAQSSDEVRWEMADLLYFSLVKLQGADVSLEEVVGELERRSLKVSRRD